METIDIRRPERRIGGIILIVVASALAVDLVSSGASADALFLLPVAVAGIRMAMERVWTEDTPPPRPQLLA